MRLILLGLFISIVISGADLCAAAQQTTTAVVADRCRTEIETYCKNVAPGEGRLLACLFAYEYKLSDRCERALFDVVDELQRAVADVSYLENECKADLGIYCSRLQPGEGRLMDCLNKHEQKLSARCRLALKKGGSN